MKDRLILTVCAALLCSFSAISQTTFTSVTSGDWDDGATYGNTSPGVQGTDWPEISDNVVIASGHTVTMHNAETINDFTINFGGEFDFDGFVLIANGMVSPFISQQTGDYSANGTWLNGSVPTATNDVVITKGTTVTLTANTVMNDLSVNARAVLDDDNSGTTTIDGNLLLNGTLLGKKDTNITGGVGQTIDGSGVHNSTKDIKINGNTTILSTAYLTVIQKIDIATGVTVTNYGTVIINNDLKGNDANSEWINAANSTLECGKNLLAAGTLTASATGNTVKYSRKGNVDIKTPSGTYYNLTIDGTGTKIMLADLTITNNLLINSSTLETDVVNNFDLNIGGDFTNSSTFNENSATVTFEGTGSQIITNSSGETFYNFTINKASGTLSLANNVIVSNNLTMSAGSIDAGSNILTLGIGTGALEGTLVHTAGQIIGQFERWIDSGSASTDIIFPVGSSSNSNTATINFSAITTGGTVLFQFVEAAPGNSGLLPLDDAGTNIYNTFIDGYWDMDIASGFNITGGQSFTLGLDGSGFTAFTIDVATRLLTRSGSAGAWTAEGTHATIASPIAMRTGLSTMAAQYAFGDDTNCTGPTTSAITGSLQVCTDDTTVSYSVTDSGNLYVWTITGGTQVSGGTSANITVDWGTTGQLGNVKVVETNGCTSGAAVNLSVNINSIAPSSITGSTSVAESSPDKLYSVTDLGYTYTWTVTGGTLDTGQGSSSITVDWGAAGTGNVSVVAQKAGCTAASAFDVDVFKYIVINSARSGPWDDPTTWSTGTVPLTSENARVLNTHIVEVTADATINNFIVNAGGTLDAATSNKKLIVDGDLVLNGTYNGGTKQLELKGINTTIDGTGTFNITGQNVDIKSGNKTIASTAVLNFIAGDLKLRDANITVTNNGSVTIAENLLDVATSIWINSNNSTLKVGGTVLLNGTLNASTPGNTVNYNGTGNQNIKTPSSSYYHLTLDSLNTKTALANLDVDGNLTIDGSATFDVSANTADLTVAGDWINNNSFTHGSQTVTLDGSVAQRISGSSSTTFNNLELNNINGDITLSTPAIISSTGKFILTWGVMNTDTSNILTINDGGTCTGESAISYVYGPIKKIGNTDFTFPTGANGILGPIKLSAVVGGNATTEFTAEYFFLPAPNPANLPVLGLDHVSKVEYWEVSNNTTDVTSADLSFYWEDADVSGISDIVSADLVAVHYNNGTSEWEVLPTTICAGSTVGPGGTGCITATFTSFSPVGFGSALNMNVLPIELLYFKAKAIGLIVQLEWKTASEINNDFYTVERSKNGFNFEEILKITSFGNSNELQKYSASDEWPYQGISYYRLKQTDLDGMYTYSKIVSVSMENNDELLSLLVFPNPADGSNTNLRVSGLNQEERVTLQITGAFGKSMFTAHYNADEGGSINIPLSDMVNWSNGIYIISLHTEKGLIQSRIVKHM